MCNSAISVEARLEEIEECESASDYVTSRVLSNMRGYNILRRRDYVQGHVGRKFDLDEYNFRVQLLSFFLDAEELAPFRALKAEL